MLLVLSMNWRQSIQLGINTDVRWLLVYRVHMDPCVLVRMRHQNKNEGTLTCLFYYLLFSYLFFFSLLLSNPLCLGIPASLLPFNPNLFKKEVRWCWSVTRIQGCVSTFISSFHFFCNHLFNPNLFKKDEKQ